MGTVCVGHSITDVYPLAPYLGQRKSSLCPGAWGNAGRVLAGEGDGLAAG